LELCPDLMNYSSTPHLEHYEPSPAEMEVCVQRDRDFYEHELEMEGYLRARDGQELDEIDEELEDDEGEDEVVEGDANGNVRSCRACQESSCP
jgi:hypothetical protein